MPLSFPFNFLTLRFDAFNSLRLCLVLRIIVVVAMYLFFVSMILVRPLALFGEGHDFLCPVFFPWRLSVRCHFWTWRDLLLVTAFGYAMFLSLRRYLNFMSLLRFGFSFKTYLFCLRRALY